MKSTRRGSKLPIAGFDSATAMVRALSRYLRGQDFDRLGGVVPPLGPIVGAINALPRRAREALYAYSGAAEAIAADQLASVRAEQIADWIVAQYPARRYPAVMIGSANGALVHLCAALGVPWLPQTVLIPVRRAGIPPDEPRREMDWGRAHARPLLDANPELQLHHMQDANQDRLMIQYMTYFRVKWARLARAYQRFLGQCLEPGGTIFVVECRLRWPTVKVGERHLFQPGAYGGAEPDEYVNGSQRVAEYLERYRSPRRRWQPPPPDTHSPEAEWGFEPALRADVERLADAHGYRLRRIVFDAPEDASPLVADLYRWWYRARNLVLNNRLLAESFILMEPRWTLRTGSVPFWMVFNVERSADALERYLAAADPPYAELYLMLFSHGVDSVGVVPIQRWHEILRRVKRGGFVGVDARRYPRDFATFIRYHTDLKREVAARYPLPGALALAQLDAFLEQARDRYAVQWLAVQAAPA